MKDNFKKEVIDPRVKINEENQVRNEEEKRVI